MPQPVLFFSESVAVTSGADRFQHFFGADWWNTAAKAGQVMSSPGVVSNVHLTVSAAPGSGKSWTITLQKNEVDTAITFSIADSATTGADTTHSVSFSAGDVLCWKATPVSSPASTILRTWYFELAPTTPGITQLGNVNVNWNNTNKIGSPGSLNGAGIVAGGDEYQYQMVVPTAGSFVSSYGYQNGAGVVATGFTIMLNLNGVDQDGAGGTVDTRVAWSFQSTKSVSGGSYNLPVVAGDLVYVKFTCVGTPSNKDTSFCISFQATNTGEYFLGQTGLNGQLGSGTGVLNYMYNMDSKASGGVISASELNTTFYNTRPLNITKMYVWLKTAPGGVQSRSFTLVKASSLQALTCTIAGTAFAGNDTASGHKVRYDSGDTLALQMKSITSAPAFTRFSYSLVMEFIGGGKGAGGGNSGNKKGGGGALNIQTAGGAGMLQFGNPGLDIGITS